MIQSGQAFFVQSIADEPATLVFRETSKNANGSHEMMGNTTATPKALLRLTLQQPITSDSTDNLDGAVAVFHPEGKPGLDPLDGSKLMNSSENIFFRREARSLTFEHRPMVTAKDTLYLRMSNLQNRTYRLQVRATDFPDADGVTAELTDRFTGKSMPISLKGDTDHAFTVTADSISTGDRFMVVFRRAAAPVVVMPDILLLHQLMVVLGDLEHLDLMQEQVMEELAPEILGEPPQKQIVVVEAEVSEVVVPESFSLLTQHK
jgi:hypothetical protein